MAAVLVSPAQITVTTSGTEVRLVAADVQKVIAIYLSAPAANTGTVYIGDADVSVNRGVAIIKGTTQVINAPDGDFLDIRNIWVDAATNGDKLNVAYLIKA